MQAGPKSEVGFGSARPVTGTVAITPDHHGVTIDTDLNGSRPGEHLKGTITCP